MARRRCCCIGPCILLEDALNDDASTTLSSNWDEVSGDWSYATPNGANELKEAGTSGAVAVTTKTAVHVDMNVQVTVQTTGSPRVLVNYLDVNNYFYVEVDFTLERIVLGSVLGGVDTEDAEIVFNAAMQANTDPYLVVRVCFNHDDLLYTCITDTADEGLQWCFINFPAIDGGDNAGLGNGDTTAVWFSNFGFYDHLYHADPEDLVNCPQCLCTCGGEFPPGSLTATFWNVEGCPELDGVSDVWTIDYDTVDCQQQTLHYEPTPRPWECDICDFDVDLNCGWDGTTSGDDPCADWALDAGEDNTCWDVLTINAKNPIVCTCDPYYFYFENLSLDWGAEDKTCCTQETAALVDLEFEE